LNFKQKVNEKPYILRGLAGSSCRCGLPRFVSVSRIWCIFTQTERNNLRCQRLKNGFRLMALMPQCYGFEANFIQIRRKCGRSDFDLSGMSVAKRRP
jgi:hypothetical protein